jgi:hypothetical protein
MSVFILFLITYIEDSGWEMRPFLSLTSGLGFASLAELKPYGVGAG